ncbi:MAG TPA: type II secretion system F family protein [Actinomycetales bacterium]
MTGWAPGAAAGLVAGIGLVIVAQRLPVFRRIDLDDRLAPYLRETTRPSRLLGRPTNAPLPTLRRLLGPVVRDSTRLIDQLMGGTASVRHRLVRAGREPDAEALRAEQLLWGTGALTAGALLAALLWWRGSASVPALVVLVLVAGAFGVAARDWALTQQAVSRERRMLAEFPTVAEMLALSVSAGEGPVAALERVSRLSDGELASELRRTLADARAGASLPEALQALADRTGLVALSRFVDGIVVAVERGTPLADVLRAQAQDVREVGQRALMDAAGKKEVLMMIPVVFLILPVTVLFAVYPGFAFLQLSL